ncbi:cyclic nucleotide-binding/CBS domain-containing protein [Amphritea opalescens]|uniref:Cyclic nucleotide-binding/CBS domain-containing protein n=1 Tax=Amphritea opalescens TaxID=2490544 RepID=A0A430KML6_9GAMM|nr:DUF294 nucleotidyltransferase-like domain-containing protein [Amphritea opalescens]RTE64696.1 cyclic nucleotide-binding/CBS domain-containing protein [Amphritea opalescens]
MQAEQVEIAGFLKQYPPFDELPEAEVDEIACQVEISYFRAGTDIYQFGDEIHELSIIRSGAVEIYRRNGDLYNRLSEGEVFGQLSLLMSQRVRLPARTIEDSLIYFMPEALFMSLCDRFDSFAYFVEVDDNLLHQAVSDKQDKSDLMVSKVTTLISRTPVMADTSATIREAAQKMTEAGVSSLLIMHSPESLLNRASLPEDDALEDTSDRLLAGIITDRDLRTRVVAPGLDLDSPVTEVMTVEPVTLDVDAYAFEAMLTMLRYNLHHLPVLEDDYPVGVLATSDIIRYESQSSLYMVSSIMRQTSVDELAELQPQINACFVRMVAEGANSHMIGSAMSVIGRTFKQRLLELGEAELGAAPLPYCFLALGSMARDEQLVVTDQDNALILDNRYQPEKHGEYFAQLAKFVSDGLDRCGYVYCTGNIMATNPVWRKTRKEWQQTFTDWIENPSPEALLNCSIFFDLDGVWGKVDWAAQLNSFVAHRAQRSPKFLASLARNALNRTPPLGFFKDFVMEKDGQHGNAINLKRRGTAPLSDLIRVHALAVGSKVQNSFERLDDVSEAGILPPGRAADLRDALEFISMVRIRHQAADVEAGREPSNSIKPEMLTDFDRRNLKEAFKVLSNSQRFLKFRYPFSGR